MLEHRPAPVRGPATKELSSKVAKVTAKLHVKSGGDEKVLSDGPKSVIAFVDNSLDTTFNFQLDADQVTSDLELSVEITGATATDKVTYPADATTIDVGAVDAPKLRVQLIPVKYEADGSNRLPDLSDASVKLYRDALYKMYPVSDIELTKHAQLEWPVTVDPTGDGWDTLLRTVMTMREDEPVDPDVYYIGVFNPAPTLREYCGKQGCILGVAPASGLSPALDTQLGLRTALIVGYQTDRSGGTIAQELAHAMGRMHAPCGNPAAIDKKYPYKEAQIGSSGWDVMAKQLVDSDDHVDFMSYCSPVWVSDYTWKAINDRMVKVSSMSGSTPKGISALPSLPSMKTKSALTALSKDQIAWTIKQP